jgi:hypothetical protein
MNRERTYLLRCPECNRVFTSDVFSDGTRGEHATVCPNGHAVDPIVLATPPAHSKAGGRRRKRQRQGPPLSERGPDFDHVGPHPLDKPGKGPGKGKGGKGGKGNGGND